MSEMTLKDFTAEPNESGSVDRTNEGAAIHAAARMDRFFHPDETQRLSNVPSLTLETTAEVVCLAAKVRVGFSGTSVSGSDFEQEITANQPAAAQFLSQRQFMYDCLIAGAVAYDCAGVYPKTDF